VAHASQCKRLTASLWHAPAGLRVRGRKQQGSVCMDASSGRYKRHWHAGGMREGGLRMEGASVGLQQGPTGKPLTRMRRHRRA